MAKVFVTNPSVHVAMQNPSPSRGALVVPGTPGVPGPPGPAGGESFIFSQPVPAATWIIVHNLGRKPPVSLFLSTEPDVPVYTDLTYPDNNTIIVEWPTAESGWAEI